MNHTLLFSVSRLSSGRVLAAIVLLLALVLQRPAGAQTLFSEGFEGLFPGTDWTVGDDNGGGTTAYWDDVNAAFGGEGTHSGSSKGYCAGFGFSGTATAPHYQDSMISFMRRTLDLSGQTSANLIFWYKIPSIETDYDFCSVFIDSVEVWRRDTPATIWTQAIINLTAFVGGSHTLSFEFSSDVEVSDEGWYLDDISVVAGQPPPNDDFAGAQVLTGISGSAAGGTVNGTKEAGEPSHAGNAGGHSIWFRWVAPGSDPVLMHTTGSTFDTLLAVYTGSAVGSLTPVASNDDDAGSPISRLSFNAVAGQTYYIAVDGKDGASGLVALNFHSGGLPDLIIWGPNVQPQIVTKTWSPTDCEVLEGCAIAGTRRLLRFTTESRNIGTGDLHLGNPAGNPLFEYHSCHDHYHFLGFAEYRLLSNNVVVAVGNKVGFCLEDTEQWNPNAAARARYTCDDQGIQAGWADRYTSGLPCQYIDITGVPDGTYVLELEIDPDNHIEEANETNNIVRIPYILTTSVAPPPNNNFTNATAIAGLSGTISGSTANATREASEPTIQGNPGGSSVWYRWTAPASGPVIIDTVGSTFDTLLGAYTGTAVSALTLVADNDDIDAGHANYQSQVTFPAVAGATYRIVVDGYNGVTGVAVLNWTQTPTNIPPNNNFANAQILSGATGTVPGASYNATKEAGEPNHGGNAGGRSIWYRWTAPVAGPAIVETLGSSFDTLLGVYTGGSVSGLTLVAGNDNISGANLQSRVTFNASAGTAYQIAVDGKSGVAGTVALSWTTNFRLVARRIPNGDFQFTIYGIPNHLYAVEGSDDLTVWSTVTTATTAADGTVQVDIGPVTFATRRFYRGVAE